MLCEPLLASETPGPSKAELSLQGDDFTRQMWQMYAVFEDILERQNVGSEVYSPSHGGLSSTMIPLTLTRQFGEGRGGSEGPTPSMLAEALATPEGARLLESYERMLAEADYDVWSTIVAAPRDVGDETDEEDDDDDEDELEVIKRGLPLARQTMFEDSTTEFDSDEVLETERRPRHHYSHQYSRSNLPAGAQFSQPPPQQRSLRRHRHRVRRRLPATPTAKSAYHHHPHRLVEEMTRSSPSVHLGEGAAIGASSGGAAGEALLPASDAGLSFRRSSAPELLDNPLLETISTIEDLCESDDYGDAAGASKAATPLNSSNNSSGLSVDRDSGKAAKSEPSSSAEDKAQHSSDGDRDSVGYAGSNSVDSGYKSSCPTPELLDPCYYAQDALCNGSKRYSLASRETKPRIPMGTRVIGRHQQARSTAPWSSAVASSSLPASGSSGNGTPPSGRPEYGYYDVNLDHLMYLRQSLLSAIKRCGGAVSPARISPEDSEYSGGCPGTGSSTGNGAGSRHSSPMRSRSSSRASRESPDQHKLSPSPSSSPQFSHFRSARRKPDAGSGSRSDFGIGQGAYGAREPSPGSSRRSPRPASVKSESPIRKSPIRDARRSESENSDCPGSAVIPTLEEEIDTLLYGKAEYYDLESVQEFPCSYGTMIENKYRRSSLAKVKKLKDSTFKNQEPEYGSTKVSSQLPHAQSSLSSSSHRCPGSQASSISHQQHEGPVLEKGKPSAAQVDAAAPPTEGAMSQGQTSAECKDSADGSPTADPEMPANKAKFSEVAKCMLKIIEDIQHQQQNGGAVPASDSKTPCSGPPQEGAARMRVLEERAKGGGHRSSPAMYDSKRLSGADYHVYEEITYDLVAATSEHVFRESAKMLGGAGANISGRRRLTREDIPPPLPARPNEIFGSVQTVGKQQLPVAFASLGHQKTASHNASSPPKSQSRNQNAVKRRGNLYSLFTEQSDRRHLSQSLEREWQKSNGVGGKDSNDDEYGFKAVKKHPPL